MSVKAKLLIEDKEINILQFSFSFNQGADAVGRPSQKPVFVGLQLVIETRKDLNLADWSFSPNQTKQIELHIYPVVMGGKTRKLYFYDCHLVNWGNNFNAIGNDPMTETLEITCAGVEDSNSNGVYSAYWRETYKEDSVKPTTLDNTPELIHYYITDLDGNQIDKYDISDKIILHLETKNAIGKNLTVKIPDKTYDFRHNGIHLQNDTLKDYRINNDLEKVELEVIEQQE